MAFYEFDFKNREITFEIENSLVILNEYLEEIDAGLCRAIDELLNVADLLIARETSGLTAEGWMLEDYARRYSEIEGKLFKTFLYQNNAKLQLMLQDNGKRNIVVIGTQKQRNHVASYINREICNVYFVLEDDDVTRLLDGILSACQDNVYRIILENHPFVGTKIISWKTVLNWFFQSPEKFYLHREWYKMEPKNYSGFVTGLSYIQRGIDFEKLNRPMACLASPSQDLYYDLCMAKLYLRDNVEKTGKQQAAVIGIAPYSLWYDLSLSKESRNIRTHVFLHRDFHHYEVDEFEKYGYEYVCSLLDEGIIGFDVIEREFDRYCKNMEMGCLLDEKNTSQFRVSDNMENEVMAVKKAFNKPYPDTRRENGEVLRRYLELLSSMDMRIIMLLPPFPQFFREHHDEFYLKDLYQEIETLKEEYEIEFVDLYASEMFGNMDFADEQHLNAYGAVKVSEILNTYL